MAELYPHFVAILSVLDERGGFITKHVAAAIRRPGANARQHSGAVRSWLMQLKRAGLVRLLDDEKPDAWVRTPLGSQSLSNGGAD